MARTIKNTVSAFRHHILQGRVSKSDRYRLSSFLPTPPQAGMKRRGSQLWWGGSRLMGVEGGEGPWVGGSGGGKSLGRWRRRLRRRRRKVQFLFLADGNIIVASGSVGEPGVALVTAFLCSASDYILGATRSRLLRVFNRGHEPCQVFRSLSLLGV